MLDTTAGNFTLAGTRIVTPDGTIDGAVDIEGGQIVALRPGAHPPGSLDMGGDFLIPGIVDLHTDHVEAHVFPRAGVQWDFLNALMAHDAVVIAGGTTTVLDSLCVGASMKRPERRDLLVPLVAALERGRAEGLFRADHLLHLRCEICDPDTIALTDATIGSPLVRLVSVMDHTPGDRQSLDREHWLGRMAKDMGLDLAEARDAMAELLDRSARVGAEVRAHVVTQAQAAGLPIMSHDDRSLAHVDQAKAEGAVVSEFPTTLEAAAHARALGLAVVMGAPNLLRGGSQSGNVALRALLEADLCDVLSSDYIPRSPLDAAFAIGFDDSLPQDLTRAIAMVTDAPARLAGLTDRGRIAPGLRADLVQVRRMGTHNQVVAVWREGRRVY
ncbi:alpha-D-ribose 1-methylphosphonate 5-triphosphate diphosphatase [Tabrizicola piscis]|uniref:Alpha-D-ribose 1-methylphosphonate 5-triphosphate diphosphatase n=1 Tax=Tabrizicola piscis TaxID=2494374 RepID=A0A3S8U3U0_9RHOB|nr:alpha-D-ribose 1-methylphosphonate 5-triphosphate diphosphatase [Tabrizicola piscis]AZL58283.1 alpha-D-ribose 1-methylphosphonate 5-triphosphate diphosphatase [Tabrizicola piscis]